ANLPTRRTAFAHAARVAKRSSRAQSRTWARSRADGFGQSRTAPSSRRARRRVNGAARTSWLKHRTQWSLPRGLPFGCYRGDLQSLQQLGRLKFGNRCAAAVSRPVALHGVDRILRAIVKDPLLKEQEQEMIMGDANPP